MSASEFTHPDMEEKDHWGNWIYVHAEGFHEARFSSVDEAVQCCSDLLKSGKRQIVMETRANWLDRIEE